MLSTLSLLDIYNKIKVLAPIYSNFTWLQKLPRCILGTVLPSSSGCKSCLLIPRGSSSSCDGDPSGSYYHHRLIFLKGASCNRGIPSASFILRADGAAFAHDTFLTSVIGGLDASVHGSVLEPVDIEIWRLRGDLFPGVKGRHVIIPPPLPAHPQSAPSGILLWSKTNPSPNSAPGTPA